jgi:hypothetical protein
LIIIRNNYGGGIIKTFKFIVGQNSQLEAHYYGRIQKKANLALDSSGFEHRGHACGFSCIKPSHTGLLFEWGGKQVDYFMGGSCWVAFNCFNFVSFLLLS